MDRLFLVVREDLVPAQQAVQAIHAARAFVAEYPAIEAAWHASSNTLALLAVPDEAALAEVAARARDGGFAVATFHEEDLGGELTAVALEPRARRFTRALPRALGGR